MTKQTYNIIICGCLILLNTKFVLGQATTASPSNSPSGTPVTDYIGWSSGVNANLVIKNEDSYPINFYTNAGSGSLANLRMMIFDNTGSPSNAGFVGIGSNLGSYNPLFPLDVQNGMNVNFSGTTPISSLGIGYSIGGNTVLQVPGTENTFAGVNTGSSWSSGTGNSFFGTNAGSNVTIGRWNTFIGANAGAASDEDDFNTYVGNLSGTNNQGNSNSFFGHHSGFNAIGGNFNTFIGEHAGFGAAGTPNSTGANNTFVGRNAGADYTTAHENTLIGAYCGENITTGDDV